MEFLCDQNKEGTEGEWTSEDEYEADSRLSLRDEDQSDDPSSIEHQLKNDDAALIWEGYGSENGADVLRLTWYTKHACEKRQDSGDDTDNDDKSSHWGFFTWFVIV